MSPDPTGVATPREPGPGIGDPTTASFRGSVEQVDETTGARHTAPAKAPPGRVANGGGRSRARKVHRIVRHVEPWSVLKVSLLFFLALFLIICVASAVLWNGARRSGAIENVESFITEVGSFGICPPLADEVGPAVTVDPAGPISTTTTTTIVSDASGDEGCADGAERVGTFKFDDGKIFEAFALGGTVLVLAGSAGAVVMALLFNLMSDLTGGVRVTVLEVDPAARSSRTGSPGRKPRD